MADDTICAFLHNLDPTSYFLYNVKYKSKTIEAIIRGGDQTNECFVKHESYFRILGLNMLEKA